MALEIYVFFYSSEYDLDPTWIVTTSPFDLNDIGHPKIDLGHPSGQSVPGASTPEPAPADTDSTTIPSSETTQSSTLSSIQG